jgi:hypothetical protein
MGRTGDCITIIYNKSATTLKPAQSSLHHFPKIYMRTRGAQHNSIANGGLKHSGIAIICTWGALQFRFKTPDASVFNLALCRVVPAAQNRFFAF